MCEGTPCSSPMDCSLSKSLQPPSDCAPHREDLGLLSVHSFGLQQLTIAALRDPEKSQKPTSSYLAQTNEHRLIEAMLKYKEKIKCIKFCISECYGKPLLLVMGKL